MCVRLDQTLPRQLRGAVERGLHGERARLGCGEDLGLSVDRAGGREGDAVDACGSHRLEHDGGRDRVLLEIAPGLVEPVTHVRVRREVEDGVAALERAPDALLVEHVALHELDSRPGARAGDELAPSPGEVVVDDDLDALGAQPVRQGAADESSPAGDESLPHVLSEPEAGGQRCGPEHLDGLERERVEILAQEIELRDEVVRHRDDVAADRVGLDEVQDLARAGPDELGRRVRPTRGSRATRS